MPDLGRRSVVAALTGALCLGLVACGGDGQPRADSGAAAPVVTSDPVDADSEPTAQPPAPVSYDDPFVGARQAAEDTRSTATALASGFAGPGATQTEAATLRADLTHLLTEHVYLAGLALDTARLRGPNDPQSDAALAALDENSIALADTLGAVTDEQTQERFLTIWRGHVDDLVAYAGATKAAGRKAAQKRLRAHRRAAARLLRQATENRLTAKAVNTALAAHVRTLTTAIDAMTADDADVYPRLRAAANRMPAVAAVLAAGIDKSAVLTGDPGSDGAALRAAMTHLFAGHAYLTGSLVFTAYTRPDGTAGPGFQATADALSANTAALTARIADASGVDREDFDTAWQSHIGDFITYALAAGDGDSARQASALDDLAAYATSAAALLVPGGDDALTAQTVRTELRDHIGSLTGTIDAMAEAFSP